MTINAWILKVLLSINILTLMYLTIFLYPLANKKQLFGENSKSADQFLKDLNSAEEFIHKSNRANQFVEKSGKFNSRSVSRNSFFRNGKYLPIRTHGKQEITYMTLLENYHKHTELYYNMGLCAGLFQNNSQVLEKSAKLNTSVEEDQTTLRKFLSMTQECSLYKTVRRFRNKPVSTEEENFPIAMSILIHNNLEQFERLLKSLYHPQNTYCIHVDDKASPLFKAAAKAIVNCFDNVFLVSKQLNVVYASFSRLQADWNCLADHRKRFVKWRYHINLAGSEFPLVSNPELVKILKLMNGSNDIRERYSQRIPSRFSHKYIVTNGTIHKSKEKLSPPPYNMTITKGLAYNTISREFVEYIFTNKAVQKLFNWSKETYSPDEHFWSTVNDLYHNTFLKSPGGYKGHPDDKHYFSRYINWKSSSDRCHGTYIHKICIFSYGDLWYLQLKHQLIANKFDIRIDSLAFSCMEELVQYRTKNPRKINPFVYRTGK